MMDRALCLAAEFVAVARECTAIAKEFTEAYRDRTRAIRAIALSAAEDAQSPTAVQGRVQEGQTCPDKKALLAPALVREAGASSSSLELDRVLGKVRSSYRKERAAQKQSA